MSGWPLLVLAPVAFVVIPFATLGTSRGRRPAPGGRGRTQQRRGGGGSSCGGGGCGGGGS